jgi:2-keto-myo-inositol isomerase
MSEPPTRRTVLRSAATAAAGFAAGHAAGPGRASAQSSAVASGSGSGSGRSADPAGRFPLGLNTATVRGHELSLPEQIDLAIEAGYDAIEPWVRDLKEHENSGGSLEDLAKRCADHGLAIPSAIGFARWIVEDDQKRGEGLAQMKRDMDRLRRLGGTGIAAPPVGAHREGHVELDAAAERYHAVLEAGRETGVVPQIEVWGFAANLSRLAEAVYVATAADHPDACVLGDVYHFFKGGSSFEGLGLLGPRALHCFHLNDYPDIPRAEAEDSDRVFPGDGVAPLDRILSLFEANGAYPTLSLELFNPDYWQRDAIDVAKTGLEKMRAAVRRALG